MSALLKLAPFLERRFLNKPPPWNKCLLVDIAAKNAKIKLALTLLKQSHGFVPRTRHKGALAREHTRLSGPPGGCEMHSALA